MARINYEKLFTRRKDGTYQKYVNGKYLYSKDPEELYRKWQTALSGPPTRTVREVAEDWERQHREKITPRTWRNYQSHYEDILNIHGDKLITELTAKDIIYDLERAKAQNYSATIIKSRKAIYSQILDFALASGEISFNPASSIKPPKGMKRETRRAPTDEEIKQIAANIHAHFGFFPFFLLCTGLRKGEALALTRSDIDLKQNIIHVTKSVVHHTNAKASIKEPKTKGSVRNVPIIGVLRSELENYLSTLKGDILFPSFPNPRSAGGGYMSQQAYEVAWKKYVEETGIDLTAHQLRHGAATLMFEAGVDVYTAQSVLGHSNIQTTMSIYTELRQKQRDKSIAKFDERMNEFFDKG